LSETITICSETDVSQFAAIAVPTGTILPFPSNIVPSGYLPCDGAEVSRTTYAALFGVIGAVWGEGDGSTTFALPDMRGRTPIGSGQSTGLTDRIVGEAGGEETHQLTVDEMPSHGHALPFPTAGAAESGPNRRTFFSGGTVDNTNQTGGDQPHNNMQPFLVVNYIIKV
tara:strand:+ start:1530 stop:2036 length:507 start_codon:yes stop_codon:yes gene_type:complete